MGIDPYEFRKKNVLLRGDFVAKGTPSMDTDYLDLMQQAIAGIGWDGRSNLTPSDKSAPPGSRWVRGRGMALSLRMVLKAAAERTRWRRWMRAVR